MSDREYVRRYFSEHARQWLRQAYGDGRYPTSYPVGIQRLRLAMEAVLERLGALRGHLVDLGCGGGELAAHAAGLWFEVTGVDIAAGMIEEAEARRRTLPDAVGARLRFRVVDVISNGLPAASADAVTAIGLIEYLDADEGIFAEAARLLRPGGVLVVSCRNRLFNLASVNDYTRAEIEAGAAAALLGELRALGTGDTRDRLKDFLARLRSTVDQLDEALALDLARAGELEAAVGPEPFGRRRRQHTPRELARSAAAAGFSAPAFLGVHPHLFPPPLEALAPRFFNQLAGALEALESTPASLGWSSAFMGVFTR